MALVLVRTSDDLIIGVNISRDADTGASTLVDWIAGTETGQATRELAASKFGDLGKVQGGTLTSALAFTARPDVTFPTGDSLDRSGFVERYNAQADRFSAALADWFTTANSQTGARHAFISQLDLAYQAVNAFSQSDSGERASLKAAAEQRLTALEALDIPATVASFDATALTNWKAAYDANQIAPFTGNNNAPAPAGNGRVAETADFRDGQWLRPQFETLAGSDDG